MRVSITSALRGRGIGHYPEEFPDRQWTSVRLYMVDSPAGRLVDAVLHPATSSDQTIREVGGGEATQILSRIRELVCE
ncbi:MAG: hypothetical protein ACYDAQ_01440 [Mycobacteriales bacterium]